MPEQMMRISGRGKDGLAKAVQTDVDGSLITKRKTFEQVVIETALTIGANTSSLITNINVEDYVSFSLGLRSTSGAPKVSVSVEPYISEIKTSMFSRGGELLVNKQIMNGNLLTTPKYLVKQPKVAIRITNETQNDIVLKVYLYPSSSSAGTIDWMSQTEFYGKDLTERPSPYNVKTGAMFMNTTTKDVWINTSEGWLQL